MPAGPIPKGVLVETLPCRLCRPPGFALVAATLFLTGPAAAQGKPPTALDPIADSAHAISIACAVVLALRPAKQRYPCQVVAYQETPKEFILRVREQPPAGAPRLVFEQSVVHFSKLEPLVTVSRVPEQ